MGWARGAPRCYCSFASIVQPAPRCETDGLNLEPSRFSVDLQFKVQTYDIDFAGIVSNQVYIRWLEDLRLELLDTFAPLGDQLERGYVPVLVSTEITYKRALRLFDRPRGRLWMADMGRVRWTLDALITNDGVVAASARHVCAFVDTATLRPRPVPSEFRARFCDDAPLPTDAARTRTTGSAIE